MGGSHSREELETSDEEEYESESNGSSSDEDERYEDSRDYGEEEERKSSGRKIKTPSSMEEVEAKLRQLKLKYDQPVVNPNLKNAVKLYVYARGNTPTGKWMVAEKVTGYIFVKSGGEEEDVDEDADGENEWWLLKVGEKVRVRVSAEVQLKTFGDQKRADFVANGVWAMKFFNVEDYKGFVGKFQECLFENTYGVEATDANKVKLYGKDFIGWVKPEAADDSMWEDADENFAQSPNVVTPVRTCHEMREEFEEAADGDGIQSFALGALDNSFLVGDSGIQVVKNYAHGIQGKGVYVNFYTGNYRAMNVNAAHCRPKKGLLMRAETNMLLMSPMTEAKPHSKWIHQLDIETGRIVTEWKFEKDGTDITMRDITNDGKGAQLDPSGSTFFGLDDNRLCWNL